jgi:hypothetical protein
MSILNKLSVVIAFAVCTTNAWAAQCKKQRVSLLNNGLPVPDVFYFSEDKVSDTIVNGYLCDKNCSYGKIVYFDRSAVIHSEVNGRRDEERYGEVFCDKSGRWEGFSHNGDVFSEFSKNNFVFCDKVAGAEDAEVVFEYDGVKFAVLEGHVEVWREERAVFVSGNLCVKRDTSKSTSDCGNVGQRECDGDYKFYVCKTDADCDAEHLPANATAGHCVSAGRSGYKVCTATDCGENYELARDKNGNSQGWCRKKSADKNEKSDTDGNSGDGQGDTAKSNDGESGAATSTIKSGDGKGESATETTQEEIEKSDNVFAEIDVDLIKYFSKSSVWTKEDGSFNTARLASDSIAGVVLGTTGGIITSNVIKKNQIKKGFEDLKCTIGGQSVAAYGDEFSVGVK